jgi:D-beta-D-heptose 7-phosphate kinase/D-beta-D-heptose 1-phosphate adenosyltransferase
MLGKHLEDAGELAGAVALLRAGGKRIVFTNGCFDVLHRGHLSYLHQARSLGDALIVGVNSDDGVRRLKGMGRPLNPLEDRLELLAGLSCVDHVIAFDEDTPAALIEVVAPEVYAKGGDYTRERLPEAEQVERLGGEVVLLPLVDDRSTTRLIERAQSAGLVAAAGRPGT